MGGIGYVPPPSAGGVGGASEQSIDFISAEASPTVPAPQGQTTTLDGWTVDVARGAMITLAEDGITFTLHGPGVFLVQSAVIIAGSSGTVYVDVVPYYPAGGAIAGGNDAGGATRGANPATWLCNHWIAVDDGDQDLVLRVTPHGGSGDETVVYAGLDVACIGPPTAAA